MSSKSPVTPPQFTDGSKVFEKYKNDYITHDFGLFVLAPSGSGKTHFVKHQTEMHWIDGDDIWTTTGAHPDMQWWTMGTEVINEVDMRSDIVTFKAKQMGLWIVGASQYWLRPDGIVIPPWETLKKYIKHREENNYDGGATSDDHSQVQGHIEYMKGLAERENVPIFETFEEAEVELKKATQKS